MPPKDDLLRAKLAALEKSTAQALNFAPLHVKAAAEFVAKPLFEMIRELIAQIERLEKDQSQ